MNLDELSEWLAACYDLARPITCRLVRSYTNDVYAVETPGGRFVLKLYRNGWRTEPEVRYEVALLRHLSAKGLSVAAPVAGKDNDAVKMVEAPGAGRRPAVLFEYAPGEKPQPPFTPALYVAFGQAVAQMHELSDDFDTEHMRSPLDLNHLIDEPLALALPLFEQADDRDFVTHIAGRVKDGIHALACEGLDWGPIHGDATLDNLHVTAEGEIVLYDFDSGGPGWRAADLQGWAAADKAGYAEKRDAFQSGYSGVRPIKPVDLRAAPYLTIAWDIWGIKIDLDYRILQQGREHTGEYLSEQAALLRERERTLLRG